MKISFDNRKTLVDELRYVAKGLLDEEGDIWSKIYIYSGAYAMVNRVFNIEFDPELVLMHSVLQKAYAEINGAFDNIAAGRERVIKIPEGLFRVLGESMEGLADAISKEGDVTPELRRMAVAGYVMTGNGYYLYRKGVLKL